MIISWDWWQQYVDADQSIDQVTERLTMTGLNLESIEAVGDDVAKTVVDVELDVDIREGLEQRRGREGENPSGDDEIRLGHQVRPARREKLGVFRILLAGDGAELAVEFLGGEDDGKIVHVVTGSRDDSDSVANAGLLEGLGLRAPAQHGLLVARHALRVDVHDRDLLAGRLQHVAGLEGGALQGGPGQVPGVVPERRRGKVNEPLVVDEDRIGLSEAFDVLAAMRSGVLEARVSDHRLG